jgi:hypothetical protein
MMSAVDHVYFATRAVEQARDVLKQEGVGEPALAARDRLLAASQLAMCISTLMTATSEISDVLMNLTLKLSEERAPSQEAALAPAEPRTFAGKQ